MTAATTCRSCGTEPLEHARFCHRCGSPVAASESRAEYKQVTVLFADVVQSMDIAVAVGAERLREIMTELVSGATRVVDRYGGTTEQFTGDGIMALFGAPVALEDHALRACLAALAVQTEITSLASEVRIRDGVDLRLRIGLNSGEVIAGDMGSGSFGYIAIGEQVGMAQRMESAAPPGGVMLSASTARLVENTTVLGEPELVRIKGVTEPVAARRLQAIATQRRRAERRASSLVGRQWELDALTGLLQRSTAGQGCVVGIVGPAGIGKSRLIRELTSRATTAGVDVVATACESHARDIPFHVAADLLRAAFKVTGLDEDAARSRLRDVIPDADREDLLLFDDLLGVADPAVALPNIDPDARRRRLIALVNAAAISRRTPAVFVIEDAHWIDEISDSMLTEYLAVIPQTPSLVLVTYRPEYRGALTRLPGAQTISLAPLANSPSITLTTELLGLHPSVVMIAARINAQAAGNPFFIEEMVRELAEQGVLRGERGDYECHTDIGEIAVPATLQATIAARIDRLGAPAKRTLGAAAVIGSRFDADLLLSLGIDPVIDDLIEAELIEQVSFTWRATYSFRHPLIRTVAYESQLKSDRADVHRRLAEAIESREPESVRENAAAIAEHLEAAADLPGAYSWHMRAGRWSSERDIAAAQASWRRARNIADRLPADHPDRMANRIAPRVMLCVSAWRTEATLADTGFDEVRDLCDASGDQASLAFAMAGQSQALLFLGRYAESSRLVSDWLGILDSKDHSQRMTGFHLAASNTKFQAGEATEGLRLAQSIIDIVDGDPARGQNLLVGGSPLALALGLRGAFGFCLGTPGWNYEMDQAVELARGLDANSYASVVAYKAFAILNSARLSDEAAILDTAEALKRAEQSGDDLALIAARCARGIALVNCLDSQTNVDDELAQLEEAIRSRRFSAGEINRFGIHVASRKSKDGDLDGAIEIARGVVDFLFETGEMLCRGPATMILVESLLNRGAEADLQEARGAIDRLAAVPTEPGFVLHELPLLRLRALLARADGDKTRYRTFADRYRARATELDFEGHMALAASMS